MAGRELPRAPSSAWPTRLARFAASSFSPSHARVGPVAGDCRSVPLASPAWSVEVADVFWNRLRARDLAWSSGVRSAPGRRAILPWVTVAGDRGRRVARTGRAGPTSGNSTGDRRRGPASLELRYLRISLAQTDPRVGSSSVPRSRSSASRPSPALILGSISEPSTSPSPGPRASGEVDAAPMVSGRLGRRLPVPGRGRTRSSTVVEIRRFIGLTSPPLEPDVDPSASGRRTPDRRSWRLIASLIIRRWGRARSPGGKGLKHDASRRHGADPRASGDGQAFRNGLGEDRRR